MRSLVVLLSTIVVLGFARADAPRFSLEEFRPAVDSQGFVTVNASQTLAHLDYSVGLVGSYALDTLSLHDRDASYRVEHLVTMQLQGAIGLFGGGRWRERLRGVSFELGASLPVHILEGTTQVGGEGASFSAQAVGDVGLRLKTRFLDSGRRHIGIALLLAVDFPSGKSSAFLGEGQTTFRPTLIFDKVLGRLRLGLDVGAIVRPSAHTFADAGTGLSRTLGHALTYALGVSYAVVPQRFELVGEVFGSHDFVGDSSPLEVLAAAKVYLATSSYFEIGASAGALPRRIVDGTGNMTAQPTARAFVGFVFEPSVGDRDHDGIKDDIDRCPDEPETRNGFEDEDGCPDEKPVPPVVVVAAEPEPAPEPETPIPDFDEKPVRVQLKHGVITTFEKVYFKTASAEILPRSFALLDDIASLLRDTPGIELLEVAGHADERGDDGYNLRLTQARAQSVRRYLVGRGIKASRLTAHGYGETQPATDEATQRPCTAHTEVCWEKNRRVEFRILRPAL